ncbi:hypothetical protein PR048_023779 [Dryococelus australis]|uniref:Uncharacterized protein n=1 Tax=Dryococelus australis TaxID=614101 RepID=A0ABQ9GV35_9NEOP|nr:hypothetical protein PR048_023779 [Dryococelus australis]
MKHVQLYYDRTVSRTPGPFLCAGYFCVSPRTREIPYSARQLAALPPPPHHHPPTPGPTCTSCQSAQNFTPTSPTARDERSASRNDGPPLGPDYLISPTKISSIVEAALRNCLAYILGSLEVIDVQQSYVIYTPGNGMDAYEILLRPIWTISSVCFSMKVVMDKPQLPPCSSPNVQPLLFSEFSNRIKLNIFHRVFCRCVETHYKPREIKWDHKKCSLNFMGNHAMTGLNYSVTPETLHALRVGAMRHWECMLVSPVSLPRFLALNALMHTPVYPAPELCYRMLEIPSFSAKLLDVEFQSAHFIVNSLYTQCNENTARQFRALRLVAMAYLKREAVSPLSLLHLSAPYTGHHKTYCTHGPPIFPILAFRRLSILASLHSPKPPCSTSNLNTHFVHPRHILPSLAQPEIQLSVAEAIRSQPWAFLPKNLFNFVKRWAARMTPLGEVEFHLLILPWTQYRYVNKVASHVYDEGKQKFSPGISASVPKLSTLLNPIAYYVDIIGCLYPKLAHTVIKYIYRGVYEAEINVPLCVEIAICTFINYSPPTKANLVRLPAGSPPDSRTWEPCRSMPLVGRFFWGISRFSHPFVPALLHTHLASPSSILKTSMSRAAKNLFIHSLKIDQSHSLLSRYPQTTLSLVTVVPIAAPNRITSGRTRLQTISTYTLVPPDWVQQVMAMMQRMEANMRAIIKTSFEEIRNRIKSVREGNGSFVLEAQITANTEVLSDVMQSPARQLVGRKNNNLAVSKGKRLLILVQPSENMDVTVSTEQENFVLEIATVQKPSEIIEHVKEESYCTACGVKEISEALAQRNGSPTESMRAKANRVSVIPQPFGDREPHDTALQGVREGGNLIRASAKQRRGMASLLKSNTSAWTTKNLTAENSEALKDRSGVVNITLDFGLDEVDGIAEGEAIGTAQMERTLTQIEALRRLRHLNSSRLRGKIIRNEKISSNNYSPGDRTQHEQGGVFQPAKINSIQFSCPPASSLHVFNTGLQGHSNQKKKKPGYFENQQPLGPRVPSFMPAQQSTNWRQGNPADQGLAAYSQEELIKLATRRLRMSADRRIKRSKKSKVSKLEPGQLVLVKASRARAEVSGEPVSLQGRNELILPDAPRNSYQSRTSK